jgi:GxxExxY protein
MPEPNAATDLTAHQVIGAAIEVHRVLGPGFLESVYEQAMSVEMKLRGIPFSQQDAISMIYKDVAIGEGRLDFLVNRCLVVELKAVDSLAPVHSAQVISYLRATGCTLGLLINFNAPLLKEGLRRIVLS